MSIVVNKTRLPVTQWQTESGSVVSISDARKRYAKSLSVALEPIQSGSGDPSPTNIRPISGTSSVTAVRAGKNLLDLSSLRGGNFDNAYSFPAANIATGGYFPIKGSQTYALSQESYPDGSFGRYLRFYDADKTQISSLNIYTKSTATFTAPNDARYLRVMWYSVNIFTSLNDVVGVHPQIEIGSATAYEPYQGISVTLSLGQTVYGGSVDLVSGVLTVTKAKIALRGIGNWYKSTSYPGGFYTSWAGGIYGNYDVLFANRTPFISSHAKTAEVIGDYVFGTCFSDNSCNFRLMSASNTVADWLNYMDTQYNNGTPIEICGTLANPRTIQLSTNQIEMLMRNNTVWSDAGLVTLEYARIRQ